jgi:hypothetical protein
MQKEVSSGGVKVMPKQVAIATRIIVLALGLFLIGGAILSMVDPTLGFSSPPYPTRTQAALSGIWLVVYAVFLLIPPSVFSRKRSYLLGAVTVRGLGCVAILFGVGRIVPGTSGGAREVILALIFTGIVLAVPAMLAVVELFFGREVR